MKILKHFSAALCCIALLGAFWGCGASTPTSASSAISSQAPENFLLKEEAVSSQLPQRSRNAVQDEGSVPNTDSSQDTAFSPQALVYPDVQAFRETPLFSKRGDGDQVENLPAGTSLTLLENSHPMWLEAVLENGTKGYVHTGDIRLVTEDGTTSALSYAEELVSEKLATLQEAMPEGKYWNHVDMGSTYTLYTTTNRPCEHSIDGEEHCNIYNGSYMECFPFYDYLCQCLGFANVVSDTLFTWNSPIYFLDSFENIQLGDHLRLNEYEHSAMVVDKTDTELTVAEVNADYEDCLISWGRIITRDEFDELFWDMEVMTRYPYRDSTGTILPASSEDAQENHQSGIDAIVTFYENYPYANGYSDARYEDW